MKLKQKMNKSRNIRSANTKDIKKSGVNISERVFKMLEDNKVVIEIIKKHEYSDINTNQQIQNLDTELELTATILKFVKYDITNKEFYKQHEQMLINTDKKKDIDNLLRQSIERIEDIEQKLKTMELTADDTKALENNLEQQKNTRDNLIRTSEKLTNEINEFMGKIRDIVHSIKNLEENHKAEYKFLCELLSNENINFGINDIYNVCYYLYSRFDPETLHDELRLLNGYMIDDENIVEKISLLTKTGNTISKERINKISELLSSVTIDNLSEYKTNITSVENKMKHHIEENIKMNRDIKESVQFDNNTGYVTLTIPQDMYYTLSKIVDVFKKIDNVPKNQDLRLNFAKDFNINTNINLADEQLEADFTAVFTKTENVKQDIDNTQADDKVHTENEDKKVPKTDTIIPKSDNVNDKDDKMYNTLINITIKYTNKILIKKRLKDKINEYPEFVNTETFKQLLENNDTIKELLGDIYGQ